MRGNVFQTAANKKSYLFARLLELMGGLNLIERNLIEKGTFCLFFSSLEMTREKTDFTFYSSILFLPRH
jgi:hypothetical protein